MTSETAACTSWNFGSRKNRNDCGAPGREGWRPGGKLFGQASVVVMPTAYVGRTLLRLAGRMARAALAFAAQERGATFVEFALVAPPLFLLIIGIFEVSIVMFTQTHLQGATMEAARQVRTGNVQADANPSQFFENLFCNQLVTLIRCDERLITDVRATDMFADISFPAYFDSAGHPLDPVFQPGDTSQTVVVRAAYTWKVMTPMLARLLANNGSDGRIITATVIVKNEPFGGALE